MADPLRRSSPAWELASVQLLEPVERVAACWEGPARRTVMRIERGGREPPCGPGEGTGVRGRHADRRNAAQRVGKGMPPLSHLLGLHRTTERQADPQEPREDSATECSDPTAQGGGNDTAPSDPRRMRCLQLVDEILGADDREREEDHRRHEQTEEGDGCCEPGPTRAPRELGHDDGADHDTESDRARLKHEALLRSRGVSPPPVGDGHVRGTLTRAL